MKQLFIIFILFTPIIVHAQLTPIETKHASAMKVAPIIEMVNAGSFEIGKYEVTQAQWKAVMGANPAWYKNCNNCPIENVSWNDVQEFIKKLNTLTGKAYRLPTSDEWLFAARGGSASDSNIYAGSNDIDTVAWYFYNSSNTTHPVGQKKPNRLGIYDMSGNVWEWCNNMYDSTKQFRVICGGAWSGKPKDCLIKNRTYSSPTNPSADVGFRIMLSH